MFQLAWLIMTLPSVVKPPAVEGFYKVTLRFLPEL